MKLDELYLNTNKLNELDPELKSHFIHLHKECLDMYKNCQDVMSNFTYDERSQHPYTISLTHILQNLIKHDILVSEREFNIDELLTD